MLLPALNKAREKAQTAGCTNNLKQVGVAINLYIDDNDSYFPFTGKGVTYTWAITLSNLLNTTRTTAASGSSGVLEYKSSNMLFCPSHKHKLLRGNFVNSDYFVNKSLFQENASTTAVNGEKSTVLRQPARTALVADGTDSLTGGSYAVFHSIGALQYGPPYSGFVHGDGLNLLFADGHVEWRSKYNNGIKQDLMYRESEGIYTPYLY